MADPRPENSTNVRSSAEDVLRAGIGAIDQLSPEAAARAAEEIFVTPRRRAAAGRLPDAPPPTRLTIEHRGQPLAAVSWGSGPTVLLVHGWEGRGDQLAPMVPALVDAGFRVVTYDAPAHGDSPGRQLTLGEHADAILAVDAAVGPLRAVVAHSFGAAAATVAMSRGLQVERVAYVAPMLSPLRAVRDFARRLGLSAEATSAFMRRLERRNAAPIDRLEASRLAPMMTARLLAIVDDGDRVAPPLDAAAVVGRWPDADLIATRGLGHRAILGDAVVVSQVAAFVAGAPPVDLGELATGPVDEPVDLAAELDDHLFNREARMARVFG